MSNNPPPASESILLPPKHPNMVGMETLCSWSIECLEAAAHGPKRDTSSLGSHNHNTFHSWPSCWGQLTSCGTTARADVKVEAVISNVRGLQCDGRRPFKKRCRQHRLQATQSQTARLSTHTNKKPAQVQSEALMNERGSTLRQAPNPSFPR